MKETTTKIITGVHYMKTNNYNNLEIMKNLQIETIENSMLVTAKRKIFIPDNKIIMENHASLTLSQCCQPVIGEEYGRTSTGIILAR